jgi:hypothetical protein
VIGTDLSAIQPSLAISNCVFQKDDAEEEQWVFPELTTVMPSTDGREGPETEWSSSLSGGVDTNTTNTARQFDYVHLRFMVTCLPPAACHGERVPSSQPWRVDWVSGLDDADH